jgi:Indole-3-glycerol phosphate synthase
MASLDRMISSSRRALEQRRGARPLVELEDAVADLDPIRPFTEAVVGEEIAFVLRVAGADPGLLAAAGAGGVAGLAVPGDAVPPGFEETRLPVLHKGVLIDPYQLYESRLGGADGVVLIAEAFDGADERCIEMQAVAAHLGLDVVVEVAGEEDLEHVLDLLDPDSFLIQNLRGDSPEPDFEHTFSLIEEVPAGKVVLSEGGIRSRDEVVALEMAGVDAVVLGGDRVYKLGIGPTLDVLRGDARE